MQPWKVLDSRYLLKRWWMRLREDHVRTPSGHEIEEFHVLEYPDWALAVPLTAEGEVVMVEQYRHGIERVSLELPGGVVDEGETPEEAARRELREEAGCTVETLHHLGTVSQDPHRMSGYAHLYLATGAKRVLAQDLDAAENLHVRTLPAQEALALADAGEIVHGQHALALFWASHRGWL